MQVTGDAPPLLLNTLFMRVPAVQRMAHQVDQFLRPFRVLLGKEAASTVGIAELQGLQGAVAGDDEAKAIVDKGRWCAPIGGLDRQRVEIVAQEPVPFAGLFLAGTGQRDVDNLPEAVGIQRFAAP